MKKLTIIAEDWKPSIDMSLAVIAVWDSNVARLTPAGWIDLAYSTMYSKMNLERSSFYKIVHGEFVKIEPEPRPDGHIKLSECTSRHLAIIGKQAYMLSGVSFSPAMPGIGVKLGEVRKALEEFSTASIKDIQLFDMFAD